MRSDRGLSLYELLLIIIATGLVAVAASSKFYQMIEFSRSNEAIAAINKIHFLYQQCLGTFGGHIETCYDSNDPFKYLQIDFLPPEKARFRYYFVVNGDSYVITAERTYIDNGKEGDMIKMTYDGKGAKFSGTGAFAKVE
ncbi:MAG: hypothetical protein HQL25_06910 [Candidatus Omnitrophica bacterium]|nr:hypothetical protein [Candidatus Omnitrophota bacterium]